MQQPVFSPDQRLLAVYDTDEKLRLWETITGKLRLEISWPDPNGLIRSPRSIAFAPDGQKLAIGMRDGSIHLIDMASGQPYVTLPGGEAARSGDIVFRGQRGGHQGPVVALAFAPDGKILASGSMDTTILLWDLTRQPQRAAAGERPAAILWQELAGRDAALAHRAIWSLVARPGAAERLLGEQLKPVPVVPPERVARLIADLDSEEFEVRDRASAELDQLGDTIGGELRQALTPNVSLEARRRLERLLERVDSAALSAEMERALRAIEALELLNTEGARALLDRLGSGQPTARLTEEARAARARLTARLH